MKPWRNALAWALVVLAVLAMILTAPEVQHHGFTAVWGVEFPQAIEPKP